jgi:hypothetical protein
MAQNTSPIFPLIPRISWNTTAITTANTAKDGTGTVATVLTAKPVDGSRLDYLKVRALGTNTATVMRVFINNGGVNTTAANNVLFMERTIPATTLSETLEQADNYISMDISLPADYKINVTIGTTVAAGFAVSAVYGDY